MTTMDLTIADLEVDPYPVYARLRREEPVSWLPEVRQWLVTTWPEVNRVLDDPALFTNDIPGSPMIRYCGGSPMISREGADHQDIREALRHDYDPHRIVDHVDALVRPCAEKVAERLFASGRAELVADYFEPVATLSHAMLLGLDVRVVDAARLRRWGMALMNALTNFEGSQAKEAAAVAAMSDMDSALAPVVARLRATPDDSVIAHLIHANRAAGDGRPDADVLPVLKQLAPGQVQTGWLGGWTLSALLDRPGQLDEVRTDRWLVGAAVYEASRWNSSVGTVTRRVTRPVSLGGKEIPEGAMLAVCVASANRDETVFADPDSFDVHRTVRTHLAFGAGTHDCPAFAFVPAVARTALDVLFNRMPDLRAEPGWRPAPHGWKLRQPGPVNVVWSTG
jgi:cytochrome P450